MRDIGILIWVALLIVGVVGSMTSRIRSRRQTQPVPPMQRPQRTQPQPFSAQVPQPIAAPVRQAPARQAPVRQAPARPAPGRQPAPPPKRVGPDTAHPVTAENRMAKRLFGDRRDLVRAVIAAEVLGKPRAFGDEYTWG
jgi:hypothetical protein